MRTTLTLEPDVALELRRKLKATKRSQKEVINAALRRGLPQVTVATKTPFRVKPHSFGLKPEYDPDKMNQLYDQLLVEDFLSSRTVMRLRLGARGRLSHSVKEG